MQQVTDMKIVEDFPPNFAEIEREFGRMEEVKALFCYGNTIYNPFKREILPDAEIHEQVHSVQQGQYPDVWWYKYISDKEFRLSQEIEAYGTQYHWAKDKVHGKMREWVKSSLAKELSGPTYGSLISQSSAESKIKNFHK